MEKITQDILIALDDGHGMDTPGKRTPKFADGTFMKENEFNRAVVTLLEEHLIRCGFKVLPVAPELDSVTLQLRVDRANNAGADIFVSVHANALTGEWGPQNGIETYILARGGQAEVLAKRVHKRLLGGTVLTDRGIKVSNFYVLRKTRMPAILVECGFMDNLREAKLLRSEAYRQECAKEIAQGICDYYNVPFVMPDSPDEEVAEILEFLSNHKEVLAKIKRLTELLME